MNARGRRAVEGGEDARIVLEGVAAVLFGIDVLGGRAGHEFVAGGVEGFDDDAAGLVEPDFVGDDLGVEAGGFELVGDVDGGGVVLGGAGPVWGGGEGLEMLAGEPGVGDRHEGGVPLGLLGEVAVAEDLRGLRRGGEGGEGEQAGKSAEMGQLGPQEGVLRGRVSQMKGIERVLTRT